MGTLFLVLPVGGAWAGTMTVYSCHTPSGRTVGTTGWTSNTAMSGSQAINDCAHLSTGSLFLRLVSTQGQNNADATWTFAVPDDLRVRGFAISTCMQAETNGATGIRWGETPEQGILVMPLGFTADSLGCAGALPLWSDGRNQIERSGISSTRVAAYVSCALFCEWGSGFKARLEIASARINIEDPQPPVVQAVRGPLVENAAHVGTETIAFDASDRGTGVFRGVIEARINSSGPWREFASAVVGSGPACAPLHETPSLYEFDAPQPCPLSVNGATLEMDNALLPEGTHEIRVEVEDAAGNRTDVVAPRRYVVPNRATTLPASAPPAAATNGRGATRVAQLSITAPGKTHLTSAGAFRLAGRLLDADSNPVSGATLTVQSRAFLPKAGIASGAWNHVGDVVTGDDGVFRGRIPGGPSRSLLVTYLAAPRDATPAATAQAVVEIPAQVTVRAKRARVRNGNSVVLVGHVTGPLPPGGVLVAMEVREPTRWIPVATTQRWVRTNANGSFRLSYRFRNTFRAATYRFRVVADEDSAFQYGRGASRTITIRVNP